MLKILFLQIVLVLNLFALSEQEIAQKAHLATINTLLIFTSQDGLSSGLYQFSEIGVDMEIYHLPFKYHFKNDNSKLNYFLVSNVGYSRVFLSQDINIDNTRLDYDNHIRTYTAGLGAGAKYKFSKDFSFSGGVEFIYSKSGASVKKPDDDTGDIIEDFFNENYNDNISYKFFALAEYHTTLEEYKPYIELSYKLYETKSTFTFDSLSSFNTESSVTTLSVGAESPKLLEFDTNYLTLEAYINANYLSGAVANVVKFDTYGSLGGVVYFYTPNQPWWASRFFLELSKVHSDGLDGYNIGLGFTLDL